MLMAGFVAACGFFSLVVFDIVSIRVFGVFSGVGILSILAIEMTFIPALRSILPPPSQGETKLESEERIWDRITGFYAATMLGPNRKYIFGSAAVLIAVSIYGMSKLSIESSLKGYFSEDLEVMKADRSLNERMAGTNTMYLLIEGEEQDAIKNPEVLKACVPGAQEVNGSVEEGFEASVTYRAAQLMGLLAEFSDVTVDTDASAIDADWRWLRDVEAFHDKPGDVWRVSCKPSDGPMLAERMGVDDKLFDWGGGLIWALSEAGVDLRTKLGSFEGHATLVRAGAETYSALGRFQPEAKGVASLTTALRQKFDPRGILNAGLMG